MSSNGSSPLPPVAPPATVREGDDGCCMDEWGLGAAARKREEASASAPIVARYKHPPSSSSSHRSNSGGNTMPSIGSSPPPPAPPPATVHEGDDGCCMVEWEWELGAAPRKQGETETTENAQCVLLSPHFINQRVLHCTHPVVARWVKNQRTRLPSCRRFFF